MRFASALGLGVTADGRPSSLTSSTDISLMRKHTHERRDEVHECYAEQLKVDPTPGRRFLAALRGEG